jgi:hypothetical protein
MRFCFGFLTAMLLLFGFAGECQAQSCTGWLPSATTTGKSIDSLKAAFNKAPRVVQSTSLAEGTHYYDVSIDNICDQVLSSHQSVSSLAREWVSQTYLIGNPCSRLAKVTVSVRFAHGAPTELQRVAFQNPIVAVLDGDPAYVQQRICHDITIRGVPRGETIQVGVNVILSEAVKPKVKNAVFDLADAAADKVPGAWYVRFGTKFVVQAAKYFLADGKLTEAMLENGGELHPADPQWAEVSGADQTGSANPLGSQEWVTLTRHPRPYYLNYGPCQFLNNYDLATNSNKGPCKSQYYDPHTSKNYDHSNMTSDVQQIPGEVDAVVSPFTHDFGGSYSAMEQKAMARSDGGTLDLSKATDADNFCGSFRQMLDQALHEQIGVSLALYAHFRKHSFEFSGVRVQTGCLTSRELAELITWGYVEKSAVGL